MIQLYKTRGVFLIRAKLVNEITHRRYVALRSFFDNLLQQDNKAKSDGAHIPIFDNSLSVITEYIRQDTIFNPSAVSTTYLNSSHWAEDFNGLFGKGWRIDEDGQVFCSFADAVVPGKSTLHELFEHSDFNPIVPAIDALMLIDDIYYGSTPEELMKNVVDKGGKPGTYTLPAGVPACSAEANKNMYCLIGLKNGLVVSAKAVLDENEFPDSFSFKNRAFSEAFEKILQTDFILNYQQSIA